MDTAVPKIFAVGDIHGCSGKLERLLRRITLDRERDTIVFLGDYINKGPDTRTVLERLLELKRSCRRAIFLKGNHEQTLLEYARSHDSEALRFLREMGVDSTVDSYGASPARLRDLSCFPPDHREFLQSLEFAAVIGTTIFTHADINETALDAFVRKAGTTAMDPVSEGALLSSRRLAQEPAGIPGHTVVFGHIPFATPLVMEDRIGIDTGAVYGNVLTALELPSGSFYHA